MKLSATLLVIMLSSSLYAQKEASHWYFGDRAEILFDSCQIKTGTQGAQFANEGTAVISDEEGNLRFYTNGLSFWDSQHQELAGHRLETHWTIRSTYDYTTTTQAALIVPQVDRANHYWTFLTSPRSGDISDGRFCYVHVGNKSDSNGPLKVEGPPICLADSITERMTGIQHANGEDFWVVVQSYASGDLLSYLVNSGGVEPSPVISSTGRKFRKVRYAENNTGYMKISPDGTKLAFVYWEADSAKTVFDNVIAVLDFDAATGQASNPVFIDDQLVRESYYGVEFSPDGTKLYVSSAKRLLQLDLNQIDLAASSQTIYSFGSSSPTVSNRHPLQLAPDGRIYLTNEGHLGAVLNPNLPGSRAGVVPYFFSIQGNGSARVGLPNFVQSYLREPIRTGCPIRLHVSRSCRVDSSYVSVVTEFPERIASVAWEAHPTSVRRNFVLATPFDPNVSFTVVAKVTFDDGRDTTLMAFVNDDLNYRLPEDTLLCQGDTLWIVPPSDKSYRWSREELLPEEVENEDGLIPITEPGGYRIMLDKDDCYRRDYLNVSFHYDVGSLSLGEDQRVCRSRKTWVSLSGDDNWFAYRDDKATHLWSDGSDGGTLKVRQSGTYWLRATTPCGSYTDTVQIFFEEESIPQLGPDRQWCDGDKIVLDAQTYDGQFRWSDGSDGPTMRVSQAGEYWVEITNECGTYRDEIQLFVEPTIPLILLDTVTACAGEIIKLSAGPGYQNYRWSTGESDSVIQVTENGYYEVVVDDYCKSQRAGTWVSLFNPQAGFVPNIFTPNNDEQNETFRLDKHLKGSNLEVYNRWGKLVYENPSYQNEWDGKELPGGVYFYSIEHPCLADPIRGSVTIHRSNSD